MNIMQRKRCDLELSDTALDGGKCLNNLNFAVHPTRGVQTAQARVRKPCFMGSTWLVGVRELVQGFESECRLEQRAVGTHQWVRNALAVLGSLQSAAGSVLRLPQSSGSAGWTHWKSLR